MNVSERDRAEPDADGRGDAGQPAGAGLASAFTAFGLRAEVEPIRKGLHVVATPIGNLGDISLPRAGDARRRRRRHR